MLKRLILVAGAVAGVTLLRKKAAQQQAEQELWNEATDTVSEPPAATPTAS